MILEKLRETTREAHEELEKTMMPLINGAQDAEAYGKILRTFYSFYHPLETGIQQYLYPDALPDYAERRRTSWILDDLKALDLDHTPPPSAFAAPVITSNAQAFGALYVMEGSTLGGKIICKTIANNLGRDEKDGFRFFYGYGPESGSRWKFFLAQLDKLSNTPHEEEAIAMADEVFRQFRVWMNEVYA
jgi:heme oxygenase